MTSKKTIPEEFNEKKVIVLGTGGSGKTEFSKDLWKKFKTPIAYDINGDFKGLPGGVAYNPEDIDGEFLGFLGMYKQINEKRHVDAIFFDDADAYINYQIASSPIFKDLVVRHRNKYKVTLVFISKRPQNLPTLVVENAHTLVVYKMEGFNALNRLKDVDTRIEPMLDEVYTKPYSWILKKEGQPPELQKAIKI